MNGYRVFLEDLWGKEAEFIVEAVQTANKVSEMITQVEFMLLKQLLRSESQSDQLVQSSMQYMYASQGMLSIRALAEELCYSERNVRRIFQKELGVGPKELLGIIRFQSLLQELYKDTSSHLTELAVKYGYYDQPHFIHQFKHFYGLAPSQVFK